MAKSLMGIAEQKDNQEQKKSFRNTYYCQSKIYTYNGRLYGKYCKNRYCTICCSIRKAEIINNYLPVMKEWKEPYFLTLTIKACKANNLKKMLEGMINAFKLINAKFRKRNQRNTGIRLIGIKSLECNFNPVKNTYNPHFHIIVLNKEIAETLIDEWLNIWNDKFNLFTSRKAQFYRPVKDLESDLVETIKYSSKIFTEPDINTKSKRIGNRDIYAKALYNIFMAMKGLRIFDRFGFDLPGAKETIPAQVVTNYTEWKFSTQYHDWLTDSELTLTGYIAPAELINLLEYNIDKELE